jgi:hypothetical protein
MSGPAWANDYTLQEQSGPYTTCGSTWNDTIKGHWDDSSDTLTITISGAPTGTGCSSFIGKVKIEPVGAQGQSYSLTRSKNGTSSTGSVTVPENVQYQMTLDGNGKSGTFIT